MLDGKVGLTVEDLADISMSLSLFDQNSVGVIDLESLEVALNQLSEGDEKVSFIPPIKKLKEYGDTALLDEVMEEILISYNDFKHKEGIRKIFKLFDRDDKGWINREDFFDAIDNLNEIGLIKEEDSKTLSLAINQLPEEIDEQTFAQLIFAEYPSNI